MLSESLSRKLSKLEWLVFALIASAAILSFWALPTVAGFDGLLHVYFLDVEQGDAELIDFNGNQILIDGGPDSKILQELGRVMPFYDHSVDLVILTHPHADHVTGLIEVLKRYEVGQIIENHTPYNTAEYAEWTKEKSSIPTTQAQAGQVIDLGGSAKLTILYPFYPKIDDQEVLKNPHDAMVIFRLDYGNDSIMFTGDAEAKTEYKLLTSGTNLSAKFLKIGHHGSKTSTTENFLKAVNPVLAFIEVGKKNKYGHPHQEVLERLENYGIKYYRTDIDGAVELILDGQNYKIELGE
ncbi:MAG: MBL fold metallo-hydrolase [Candidatus Yanofskybacteria bacterium]|nr:MBL fold metallo-hydrolase [Candidatus Yanofskybacteria bacterium]